MACFERACVIAQVYLQELEKVRNVLRVLPGGLGGISRVLTAKIKIKTKKEKCQVIIARNMRTSWKVRCFSKIICKTAV